MAKKIAFIGSGHMAEAMIGGLLAAGVCGSDALWASDPVAARRDRLKSLFSIRVGAENRQAVTWADIVIPVQASIAPDSAERDRCRSQSGAGHFHCRRCDHSVNY